MSNVLRSIRLQSRTASELARQSGFSGEIFFDSTNQTLQIFNGHEIGGVELLKSDLSNISTNGGSNVDFGTKTIVAAGFTGPLTGTVSSISNHSLNELSDVTASSASSGQVLYFNGTSWAPTTLASSFNGGTITNPLIANDTTNSTINNFTIGSITTPGGLGVTKDVSVGGNVIATGTLTSNTAIDIRSHNPVRFFNSVNSMFVALRAPTNVPSNITFTLPSADGTSGQVLSTNGSGILSWVTPTGGGGGSGSSNVGGSTTNVQFNNNGQFGGTGTFTYDSVLDVVTVTTLNASSVVTTSATISSGTINGTPVGNVIKASGGFTSLIASGIATFSNATNSVSSSSGSIIISGGVGIAQDVNIGGNASVNTIDSAGDITANANVVVSTAPSLATHATNKAYVDSKAIAFSIAMS